MNILITSLIWIIVLIVHYSFIIAHREKHYISCYSYGIVEQVKDQYIEYNQALRNKADDLGAKYSQLEKDYLTNVDISKDRDTQIIVLRDTLKERADELALRKSMNDQHDDEIESLNFKNEGLATDYNTLLKKNLVLEKALKHKVCDTCHSENGYEFNGIYTGDIEYGEQA